MDSVALCNHLMRWTGLFTCLLNTQNQLRPVQMAGVCHQSCLSESFRPLENLPVMLNMPLKFLFVSLLNAGNLLPGIRVNLRWQVRGKLKLMLIITQCLHIALEKAGYCEESRVAESENHKPFCFLSCPVISDICMRFRNLCEHHVCVYMTM